MKRTMTIRLSTLMFLQIMVYGAFMPISSMYLKDFLGFSGTQTGWILSMSFLSSIIAPLIGAFLVDRIVKARVFLTACHIIAGVLMLFMSTQKMFVPFLVTYAFYMISIGPTIGLVHAITFENMGSSKEKFGFIRMWGTISWILVGWGIGYWLQLAPEGAASRLPDALRISGITSILLALYALTLPHSKNGKKKEITSFIPKEALQVLIKPQMIVMIVTLFFSALLDRFYHFGAAPYLNQIGIPESRILPALTLGQLGEIPALLILGLLVRKFGHRKILILGLCFQMLRFILLFFFTQMPLILFAIFQNGFIFAFFYTLSTVFIDDQCDDTSRGGVHQLTNIITYGFSTLIGNMSAGLIMDHFKDPSGLVNFKLYWFFPLGGALIALIVPLIFLEKRSARPKASKKH